MPVLRELASADPWGELPPGPDAFLDEVAQRLPAGQAQLIRALLPRVPQGGEPVRAMIRQALGEYARYFDVGPAGELRPRNVVKRGAT